MVVKKVPMRTCIACRSEKPKKDLIRIVKTKENVFSLDRTGKASGRGAYVCDAKSCMEKVINKKLLSHAFSMEVDATVYESIRSEFFAEK